MNTDQRALKLHEQWKGKIQVALRAPLETREDLSMAYTPGVAAPCLAIAREPADSYRYTARGNLVAVITDGSAVLGLGNIGPLAAMPVMEGKCALFKRFGGVDAIPLCIDTQDVDAFCEAVLLLRHSFGGINLEDISAPRCFAIEERLKASAGIPVFHDDQHGTAVVAAAALMNAMKVVGKELRGIRMVISGCGAAGIAVAKLMRRLGVEDIVLFNVHGVVKKGKPYLNDAEAEVALWSNPRGFDGTMAQAMKGADVFFGVSAPGIVTEEMVADMAQGAVVCPMANPVPEIMPEAALRAGAAVVGSGRSDYPNQINNLLAFPGIFRGALDAGAKEITEGMKMAAARAIAGLVSHEERCAAYIIPSALDPRVAPAVAEAVGQAWLRGE